MQELFEKVVSDKEYILVHRSSDYGTPIAIPDTDDGVEVVEFLPIQGYEIFDWRRVIEGANEIHAIDSSLCNFVDVVDTKAKLYYYKNDRVPNKWDETILRKDWQRIIE